MKNRDPREAEKSTDEIVDHYLRSLSDQKAPNSLILRVQKALAARAMRPWWQRSFDSWNRQTQVLFLSLACFFLVMFGWAAGAGLAVFGAFFATSVHYWLVRLLLRGPAEALVLRRFPRLKEGIEERGLALLVLLRFLWFPSMLVTMGSAVTRTSFRTHLVAIPAILPQAFLWCLGTDSLYTYGWDGIPLWRWALFVGVVAASILAYIYATRRWPQLKAFTRKA